MGNIGQGFSTGVLKHFLQMDIQTSGVLCETLTHTSGDRWNSLYFSQQFSHLHTSQGKIAVHPGVARVTQLIHITLNRATCYVWQATHTKSSQKPPDRSKINLNDRFKHLKYQGHILEYVQDPTAVVDPVSRYPADDPRCQLSDNRIISDQSFVEIEKVEVECCSGWPESRIFPWNPPQSPHTKSPENS